MERNFLHELLTVMTELDEEDFDLSAGGSVRSDKSNQRSELGKEVDQSPPSLRTTWNIDQDKQKTGREKFRARRKVKKLNRLLKKAEREGISIEDLFERRQRKPRIRAVINENETVVTILVDRQNAEIHREENTRTVVVTVNDHKKSVELPFELSTIRKPEKPGMTIFEVLSDEH